jgi:hypothetical protein
MLATINYQVSEVFTLSTKIRRSALNLMLYTGSESAVAAGAMVVCACSLWYYSFYARVPFMLTLAPCKQLKKRCIEGYCNRGSDIS